MKSAPCRKSLSNIHPAVISLAVIQQIQNDLADTVAKVQKASEREEFTWPKNITQKFNIPKNWKRLMSKDIFLARLKQLGMTPDEIWHDGNNVEQVIQWSLKLKKRLPAGFEKYANHTVETPEGMEALKKAVRNEHLQLAKEIAQAQLPYFQKTTKNFEQTFPGVTFRSVSGPPSEWIKLPESTFHPAIQALHQVKENLSRQYHQALVSSDNDAEEATKFLQNETAAKKEVGFMMAMGQKD